MLGHLALLRTGAPAFRPRDIERLFEDLRVPAATNVSRVLADLRRDRLVRQVTGGWALTPSGEAAVAQLAIVWSSADFPTTYTAEFSGAHHQTIPPELAPVALVPGIEAFLREYPFDGNVFAITRYPRPEFAGDPIGEAIEVARATLKPFGLTLHLASDRKIVDELWPNVAAFMWACRYGIAFVEDRVKEGVNKNVLIETGAMLATGRRCALLLDTVSVPKMPTDLIGHIREDIDIADPATIESRLSQWCSADLGLGEPLASPASTP